MRERGGGVCTCMCVCKKDEGLTLYVGEGEI